MVDHVGFPDLRSLLSALAMCLLEVDVRKGRRLTYTFPPPALSIKDNVHAPFFITTSNRHSISWISMNPRSGFEMPSPLSCIAKEIRLGCSSTVEIYSQFLSCQLLSQVSRLRVEYEQQAIVTHARNFGMQRRHIRHAVSRRQ